MEYLTDIFIRYVYTYIYTIYIIHTLNIIYGETGWRTALVFVW